MSDADGVPETTAPVAIPARRWFMAVAILVLNLADVVLTKAIIRAGGVEANPIMQPLIDHPSHPIVLKTVIALGVGMLLLASPPQSKLADRSVAAVIAIYVGIVVWNMGILARAAGAA